MVSHWLTRLASRNPCRSWSRAFVWKEFTSVSLPEIEDQSTIVGIVGPPETSAAQRVGDSAPMNQRRAPEVNVRCPSFQVSLMLQRKEMF
ncbi:hypothetical protein MRX96_008823 [Rhipicephalus microplus]